MNLRTIALYSFAFSGLALFASSPATKRPLAISDFAGWQRIEQRLISHDGSKVVFETKAQKGDGFLVIHNLLNGSVDTVHHGYEAKIAPNSEYVAFKLRLPEDSLRKLKLKKTKKEDMPKDAMGYYTFSNRQLQRIDSVKSFRLADEKGNWITYLQEKPKVKKKAVYQVVVLDPLSGKQFCFEKADTFAIATKGNAVAIVAATDTTKRRSLIVIDPETTRIDTLLSDSIHIRNMAFDVAGRQLAWLASRDTAASKNYGLYLSDLRKPYQLVADTLSPALPKGWAPSVNTTPYFSEDGTKLFFGTAKKVKTAEKDTLTDDEKAKLDIWSHTDNIIKPRQLKQQAQKKKQTYLAVYRIAENKLLQLADSTVESIRLMHRNNGDLAIGTDNKPHERSITWSSRSLTDYYLVDLKTGQKSTLLKGGQHLQLSPEGKFALWFDPDQRQYYIRNIPKGDPRPLTSTIPASLTDELHDTPDDPSPYGVAGWTEGDRGVLIYDRYDLWMLDPTGTTAPVNLTNGREKKMKYRYINTDSEKAFISTTEPILLSMVNEESYEEGYAALKIGVATATLAESKSGLSTRAAGKAGSGKSDRAIAQPESLTTLTYGPWSAGTVIKAKNSNALLWSRQQVNQFPEVEISNLSFSETKQLSYTNTHQQEFNWPTVELVNWTSFAGDSLRGLLYKPENFDPTKKYPMVVYFYERSSDTYHRYNYPQPSRSIISIPFYVSNDYLVFVPDIVYTTGYPGKNAYDAIVSGVKSLTTTREYINEKALGLQGQSWGGYQIAYLITQTDLFAAAMAGAPVSNMTSAYGGIRWGTGMSRMFQYENTQSRIGGTLWDKPLLYLENSPLFHAPRVKTPLLMMHNDNDGAVPWYQGIEYFMALYRLGKPVWLLNYNGMDHNIEAKYWANRIDLSTRMFSFFNHYLKGDKMPLWMEKGQEE